MESVGYKILKQKYDFMHNVIVTLNCVFKVIVSPNVLLKMSKKFRGKLFEFILFSHMQILNI